MELRMERTLIPGRGTKMGKTAGKQITRRNLLASAAGVGAGMALAGCTESARTTTGQGVPDAKTGGASRTQIGGSGKTFTWKLQSTWAAGDFHHQNPQDFADIVQQMSAGRLRIEVQPAGAVVPPFDVLDAVHKGLLDAGNGWPGYWYGKNPAATLFANAPGGPFGMNNEDYLGWIYVGGGLDLYNELLQRELGMEVVAFPSFGETPEPLGWFPNQIKSIEEFKGLKFRASGMSAEVFKELGMSVVTVPGGEIIPALERKVIDAAEFSDPTSDMALGFHDVLQHYHFPGIHQPTGIMEILVNRQKWEELPEDLQAIVKYGAMATALQFIVKILDRNSQDLETLTTKHGVQVHESPPDVLMEILKAWDRIAERTAQQNAFFKKVYDSQRQWAQRVVPYRRRAHPDYALAADYYWKREV
jgi:TRAP-type mannitol/chloroaromatic compound transport system substrate-binding protein